MVNGRLRPDLKEFRREQAEARQAARDQRTAQQQLERLDRAGHAAKRERARLLKASA